MKQVLVLAVGILQVWFIRRWGARWMMSMTIGAFSACAFPPDFLTWIDLFSNRLAFTLGLATRFGLHKNPQSHGLYIVEYLFVVLSVRLAILHMPLPFPALQFPRH
jgi:hypothetical protein